jgi:hypothetical protein
MELSKSAATCVCSFLSGQDALSLSHCSAFWLRLLNDSPFWQSRLPQLAEPLHAAAYKALYLRARSLGFCGLPIGSSDLPRSTDSYASISSQTGGTQLSRLAGCNFSFDLWFALLPEQPDGAYSGGILYGLQSTHAESRVWPKFHQQFVVVSSTGDLFCSVIDHRPVVTSGLQTGRWYHLALTYDDQTEHQNVYFDGVKVRSDTGALHREMEFLKHEQIGTGCVTANGLHFPKPGYLGWYGFHGLIDQFRVWGEVLTEEDVASLGHGENYVDKTLLGTMKKNGRSRRGSRWNVTEVWCSRPVEGPKLEMRRLSSRSRLGVVRPEQLPADTIKTVCSYLNGFDAFNLSHANFWWMEYLSDGAIWRRGLKGALGDDNGNQDPMLWKKRYMESRSMLFRGLQDDDDRRVDSYAYLVSAGRGQRRPAQFRLNFFGSMSFSFDVWFSLLPASHGGSFGGILYGLQSASRESRQWPYYHQQFVLVSATGDLHCSVQDSRPAVASNLVPNRWYHLALTYDNDTQSQDVYFDGVKVHSSTGALHQEWGYLTHEQVGTGCITAGKLNFPRPNYLGWYGFRGAIDDFRVWRDVLTEEDVAVLSRGGTLQPERLQASVNIERGEERLTRPITWINVQKTRCTRPAEGQTMQQVRWSRSSSQPNCIIS